MVTLYLCGEGEQHGLCCVDIVVLVLVWWGGVPVRCREKSG